ncbi:hypothetical protein [Nocardioides coralli]|uniref:hypothetical protein n=1 Tax=Nocardioides coralli TaxID=2872154 RepID=UPI001CA3D46E|nr:hypothetical protein [Nocardioides coralli]QZY29110.1 hypothetical protein K6T13_17055 [Nocardioides coralli]
MHTRLAVLAAAVLVLGSCGDDTRARQPTPEDPVTSSSEDRVGPVDEAVADLASRLVVAPGEIEVVESEAVTWNDGALGCPQPGEMYTQAQVAGHRILLRAQDRTWPYHSGGGRGPFLCENLQPSTPPAEQGED